MSDKIVAIGHGLGERVPTWLDLTTIQAKGLMAFPGLLDLHVHMAGGGGEGGPRFRTPEIGLSQLTRAGITCAVGVLGTDGTTRSVQNLLAKARALEEEGLRTFIYTGAYSVPTRTITETSRSDIVLIDKVIGIGEIAISDQRGSHPSVQALAELAGEARVGGMLSGKAGILYLHVGDGPGGLTPLFQLEEQHDVPIETLMPTHLNRSRRLLRDGAVWGKQGGWLDLTASIVPAPDDPDAVSPDEALTYCLGQGTGLDRITMSSDAAGSAPIFDAAGHLVNYGIGQADTLWHALTQFHHQGGLAWEEALRPVTVNPAHVLHGAPYGLGRLVPGGVGDLVLTDGRQVVDVIAKGRVMVESGQPVVWGQYEVRA